MREMYNWGKRINDCYKKFKKRVFYNAQLLDYKKQISEFENSMFKYKIERLTQFTQDGFRDEEYLKTLLTKITYIPFVKNIDGGVTTLNYFIYMPIELHILDTLWTILVHRDLSIDVYDDKLTYGNLIDKNSHYLDFETAKIDWESSDLFARYIKGYNKWIQTGIKKVEESVKLNPEITLLSTDLKRYYYTVSDPFEETQKHADTKIWSELTPLTILIKRIYYIYSGKLNRITNFEELNNWVLPIGLASSMLISNIYLHRFDTHINKLDNVEFYGRYVDDIIIVFKGKISEQETIIMLNKVLNEFYPLSKTIVNIDKSRTFVYSTINFLDELERLIDYLKYKQNKYYTQDNLEDLSFSRYFDFEKKQLKNNLIEKGLLHEEQLLKLPLSDIILFMNYIYTYIKFKPESIKEVFTRMQRELRETTAYHIWKEYYKWINIFITEEEKEKKIQAINSIIVDRINRLRDSIFSSIKNQNKIKKIIIINYMKYNEIAKIINGIYVDSKVYVSFKESGMIADNSLIRYFIENKFEDELKNDKTFYRSFFNEKSTFIHLWEVSMYDSLVNVIYNNKKTISSSVKDFITTNGLDSFEYIKTRKFNFTKNYDSQEIIIYDKDESSLIVSHPNIDLDSNEDFLSTWSDTPTIDETRRFVKNLIEAKENKTQLLVLPELYMYYQWLHILGYFSHQNSMSVTLGLKNIVIKNRNINILMSLNSFRDLKFHKNLFVIAREKNFYAPIEYDWAASNGYSITPPIKPIYYMIYKNKINFVDYLCYEVTDIHSRAIFKNHASLISLPMLNRDTDYFNNIIYSLSRDLSCCVVTSNSASWGNSSIILPKASYEKILTEFKGGKNQYLVSTEVPIYKLIEFNELFTLESTNKEFKKHPANFKYYNKIEEFEF